MLDKKTATLERSHLRWREQAGAVVHRKPSRGGHASAPAGQPEGSCQWQVDIHMYIPVLRLHLCSSTHTIFKFFKIIYCIHNIGCRLPETIGSSAEPLTVTQLVLLPALPAASLLILGLKQPYLTRYLTPPNAGARGRRLSRITI
eukprot:SAG22_NODE_2402_length_2615_cov_3.309618_2_plen_145_part_00